MAYIGKPPNKAIVNQATSQSFSGNGSTTAFTLTRSVNVGEDLEVFVNNVQQEPGSGKSYTASGTTLTFDEAPPSGTNNVYVIYRGEATINPRLEHDANAALSATTGTFSGDFVATGHASVGVSAVDATRALTVAGSTDDSTALGLVVYNSSLASKFSVRNDGLITTAGNIQVGGGIYLGGTGSANQISDYKTGTWTPVLGGTSSDPTVSYVQQIGWYQKIGDLVFFGGRLQWNASGSSGGSGDGVIKTLPYAAGGPSQVGTGCAFIKLSFRKFGGSFSSGRDNIDLAIETLESRIRIYQLDYDNPTGGNYTQISVSQCIGGDARLDFSGHYTVS